MTGKNQIPFTVVLFNALYEDDFDDDEVYEDAVARIRDAAKQHGEVIDVLGYPGKQEIHIAFKAGNREEVVAQMESLELPTGDAIKATVYG